MEHISFSQWKTYSSCPRQWYLSRLKGGEEKQSWYIPIGSSVHDKIEARLKGEPDRPMEDYFYPIVSKQMRIEPDLSAWLAGGPADAPITHEKALQRAVECYEKAEEELADLDVWEVEYDASGGLPGLDVPVKAFIDIIAEHKKKGPVIVDWKTGSTKPDNFQLITYAALLKHNDHDATFCVDQFDFGRYVMLAPGAANTRYVDLSEVNPAEVGAKYQEVLERIEGKHYETKAGFMCKFCFQSENCMVNSGITPRTTFYDHSTEDGYPY